MKVLLEKGTARLSPTLFSFTLPPLQCTISNRFILSPLLTELLFSDVQLFKPRVYTTTDGHNPKIHHICAQIIFSLWFL